MIETIPDLWPEEIKVDVQSPAAILRRQASQLRIRTKDSLEGELKTDVSPDGKIMYDFRIVAPALDGYTHSLFTASHDKALVYPVTVWFKPWADDAMKVGGSTSQPIYRIRTSAFDPDGRREAATPKDLLDLLKELLNSAYAKAIIMSLLARVNEAPPAGD